MRSTVQEVLSNAQTKKFEILQGSLGTFWATEKQCFVCELFWKAEKNSWKHYSKTQKSCSWQKKTALLGKCALWQPKNKKNMDTRGGNMILLQRGKQILESIAVQKYPEETKLLEVQEKLEEARKCLAETHTLEDLQKKSCRSAHHHSQKTGKMQQKWKKGTIWCLAALWKKVLPRGWKNSSLPPAAWRRQQPNKRSRRAGLVIFSPTRGRKKIQSRQKGFCTAISEKKKQLCRRRDRDRRCCMQTVAHA